MRLELLRPYVQTSKRPKTKGFQPYLWLILILFTPFNFWFLIVGLFAFALSIFLPDMAKKSTNRDFDREFPEFLMYFRVAAASTDPYQAIDVARRLVNNPRLYQTAGELSKSLMLGVVDEIDTEDTSSGFQNFIGLLKSHQRLGLSLTDTIEKLTTLTEQRYVMRQKEQIRTRPVTHTWVRLGATAALLVYMYYPVFTVLIKGLLAQ